jgi:phosphoribosylanthranilate isomerase
MMVKICGITNIDDALAAVDAGATALGFIFHRRSPRYMAPAEVARIATVLPPRVLTVGVFVDEKPREIERLVSVTGMNVAQLHGRETSDRVPASLRCWKAFRVTPEWSSRALEPFQTEAFLLDSPVQGETFDWNYVAGLKQRIILAGGLDASNVRAAITAVRPWGVDASSRLESRPGRKDHEKMRQFIEEAQSACI